MRVSGVRQWILSVSALGAAPEGKAFVSLRHLHLPPGRTRGALRVYGGGEVQEGSLLDHITDDCGAEGKSYNAEGGLVLVLTHEEEPTAATEPSPYAPSPTGGASQGNGTGASYASCGVRVGLEEEWGRDCREEGLHFSVGVSALRRLCTLERVTYQELVNKQKMGQAFMGGVGDITSLRTQGDAPTPKGPGAVWVCVRGWSAEEQRLCGVTTRQLACFLYDELSSSFSFIGTNEEVQLVSPTREREGLAREAAAASLLV